MTHLKLGLIFVAGAALGFVLCRLLAQDACLDAGGAWDAGRHVCIGIAAPLESR